jgi:hypothetical protein
MNHSEAEQFEMFKSFLSHNTKLIEALKNHEWQKAAKIYNGDKAPTSYGENIGKFYLEEKGKESSKTDKTNGQNGAKND